MPLIVLVPPDFFSGGRHTTDESTERYLRSILNELIEGANANVVIGTDTHEPTGFIDRADSQISFVNGTRTFTIEPVVANFEYYIDGTKYTKDSADDVVIDDVEGIHFVYYDGEVLTTIANPTAAQVKAIVLTGAWVAIIYWDADNSKQILLGDERHGCTMDGETHYYLHTYSGTRWKSGSALNSLLTEESGDLDAHAQFGVDAGMITDEDIQLSLSSILSTVGLPIYYKSGAGGLWRREFNPGFGLLTAGTGRLAWNELTGGAWQKTEVDNNRYALIHVWAVNDTTYPYIAVMGQDTYLSQNSAAEGARTELGALILAGLPFIEFRVVATIIFQTSDGYANSVKSRTREVEAGIDYIDWRTLSLGSVVGPVSDHNDLSGLQGGQTGEYYHLTAAEYSNIGGARDISISFGKEIKTKDATYEVSARFFFGGTTRFGTPTNIKVHGAVDDAAKPGNVRIYDITNSQQIAEKTGIANEIPDVHDLGTLANLPTDEAVFEVQLADPLGDEIRLYALEVVF